MARVRVSVQLTNRQNAARTASASVAFGPFRLMPARPPSGQSGQQQRQVERPTAARGAASCGRPRPAGGCRVVASQGHDNTRGAAERCSGCCSQRHDKRFIALGNDVVEYLY